MSAVLVAAILAFGSPARAQDPYDQPPEGEKLPPPPPAPKAVVRPAPEPVLIAPPAPAPEPVLIPPPGSTPRTAWEMPHLPLAGYANGNFFIRDPHDWFVIFPKGRLQVDWYNFPARGDLAPGVDPNGAKDPRPKDTLFVRRARAELQGTFLGHFDFHIAGEFASTPPTGGYGTLADCYIIVDYLPFLKLQAGQFDIPFTMENRTADKYFDFMERSVTVRAFGVAQNKDAGAFLFGWLPKRSAYYSIGVINGLAQNVKAQDGYGALVGRAFIAPLAPIAGKNRWMEDVWVGASWWYKHNDNLGAQVAPSLAAAQNDLPAMTTQGGVTFFGSNYNRPTDFAIDTNGNPIRQHLVPWGEQVKWAVEANVPLFKKINLRFELVHQSVDLATYYDVVNPPKANANGTTSWNGQPIVRGTPQSKTGGPQRGITLDGYSYYVQASYWIIGDVNFLETPGLEATPKIKQYTVANEPKWALMVTAKYEHIDFDINGLPPITSQTTGTSIADPGAGNYQMHVFEMGINAWGTKHVRVTGNYVLNYMDGNSDGDLSHAQVAANMKNNFYFRKYEHELLFRLAIAL